jgi:serine/threonine protein kinase
MDPSLEKIPDKEMPRIIIKQSANGSTNFVVERFLGKGAFAKVYEVFKASVPPTKYAIKVFQKDRLTEKLQNLLIYEVNIHGSLEHKGIIQFSTFFEDDDFFYIIMELCQHQTLKDMLIYRQFLTEPEVRYFAVQILLTIGYLHRQYVIHRDLKIANVFLCNGLRTKLGDFGLAVRLEPREKIKGIAGTLTYIAPEVINNMGYSFPADIWSVGCIIYTLLNGIPPFFYGKDIYENIRNCKYSWKRPNISNTAKNLVHSLLQLDPSARPTATECLTHPFFNEPIPRYLPMIMLTKKPENFEYINGDQFDFYSDINDICS